MKHKKDKTKLKYGVLSNIAFLARDIARENPLLMVFLILEMVLSVVSPVLSLYVPKIALELVAQNASAEQVLRKLGGIGLIMTLSMALSSMAGEGKYMMYNGMRFNYLQKLFLQSLDCDYELFESAKGQQKYTRAVDAANSGDQSGISQLTVATVDIFVAIASFFLYSTILSSLNPFMVAALILLSCINLITLKHARNYEYRHKDDTARLSRQMAYVENTANNWKWGKDIRMYHMSNWLPEIRDILLNAYVALSYKIRRRYFAAGTANAFTLFLRDSIAYGYLIYAVSSGSVSLGDFVLYFGAITGFSDFIGRIIDDVTRLNAANLLMNDMRAFLDHTDAPAPENPAAIPQADKLSIEFRHVWFSYDEEPVLKDFSIKIKPGEKIALVGVNGAGKTTITKLLCGFLKPDRGEILINGIPISQYCKEDLFSLFSVVFQDLFFLPFTVAENISMCPLTQTDLSRVEDCLKKVGLYDVIANYPDGIRSYMLKEINNGILLSGGQQQKLLMARALYKNAPLLLLDEPTAALDPIAESETYETFHQHSFNKTAIYISHRLASTRFCDRIILLNNGIAAEIGTHKELLKQNGEYAKMYELQSHYYKSEGGESNA